jgi:hypothetical protein
MDAIVRWLGGNRWRPLVWGGAAALLLLPAVAMRFTDEVRWGPEDFTVFGAMLLAACGGCELAAWASRSAWYRLGAAVAIATAFLLLWINLAVGVIGGEGEPANALFAGVLAVGVAGASLARLRPRGMAIAALAAVLAQAAAAAVALVIAGAWPAFALSAAFVAPWLLAAWLFGKAAASA